MPSFINRILKRPQLYHHMRHLLLGGLPFRRWIHLYGLDEPRQRIADLGCGPADILRHVPQDQAPEFYLGVDFDAGYLAQARERGARLKLNCRFVDIDLRELSSSDAVRLQLTQLLSDLNITRVLLLGVLHHIDDAAVRSTMDLLYAVPSVKTIVTQDVLFMPGHALNNFLARHDRGQFVRTQGEYETLLAGTSWPVSELNWSRPGSRCAEYIHFELRRNPL